MDNIRKALRGNSSEDNDQIFSPRAIDAANEVEVPEADDAAIELAQSSLKSNDRVLRAGNAAKFALRAFQSAFDEQEHEQAALHEKERAQLRKEKAQWREKLRTLQVQSEEIQRKLEDMNVTLGSDEVEE